jgi:hypothetical protein
MPLEPWQPDRTLAYEYMLLPSPAKDFLGDLLQVTKAPRGFGRINRGWRDRIAHRNRAPGNVGYVEYPYRIDRWIRGGDERASKRRFVSAKRASFH